MCGFHFLEFDNGKQAYIKIIASRTLQHNAMTIVCNKLLCICEEYERNWKLKTQSNWQEDENDNYSGLVSTYYKSVLKYDTIPHKKSCCIDWKNFKNIKKIEMLAMIWSLHIL